MSASTHACLVAAAAVPAHPRTKRMTTPMRRVGRPTRGTIATPTQAPTIPRAAASGRGGERAKRSGPPSGGGGRGGEIQKRLANAESAEDALRVVERDLEAFDAVHAATALHRVAKYASFESRLDRGFARAEELMGDGRFRALVTNVTERVEEFDAFGLANVAWSFAKIGYTPSDETLGALAAKLESEVLKPGSRLKPQSLSNAIYAFGRMRFKPPKSTLDALCAATHRAMESFRADELSGMMIGLAHLDHAPNDEFLKDVSSYLKSNLRRFDDAALCNVLWAYARMDKKLPDDLIDALLMQLVSVNLGGANSHVNIPTVLYACARFNHQPPPAFVSAIDKEIPRCARRMVIGSLDSMFWSLGSLGGIAPGQLSLDDEAYEALCKVVASKQDIDAELVAKVFWGIGKVNYKSTGATLGALARMAKSRANELEQENILLIMHAWGVLRWNPGEDVIVEYVDQFVGKEASTLNANQAAKLLCAYGRMRWLPPLAHANALVEILVKEAKSDGLMPATAVLGLWGASLLGLELDTTELDTLAQSTITQRLSPRSLSKCVWALAALGYDPTPIDLENLKRAAQEAWGQLSVKDQAALKQAMTRLGA